MSVALGIQHAMSMRSITLSSVACPTLHYLTNGTIFGNIVERETCILIFSITFVCNISQYKKN